MRRVYVGLIAALLSLASLHTVLVAEEAPRPVAHWNVVPDQRIDDTFNAGVVAFHASPIRVEFRIGGELVADVSDPTLNPRVNVYEFWFALDPRRYPDGPLDIEARVVPLDGGPVYDLDPLRLYANSSRTLDVDIVKWADSENGADANPGTEELPYRTLARAVANTPHGGTINLKPGTYSANALNGGASRAFWTTIQAAPGLVRDQVEISDGRPKTQRLRFRNVNLFCDYSGGYKTILSGETGYLVWLDNCKLYNKQGRWAANACTLNNYTGYTTGGITTEMRNGAGGRLVRDHRVETITSDVWSGTDKLVVNCTVVDVDRGPTDAHPDFHQSYTVAPKWVENVILYNVTGQTCDCQGFFGFRLRNSAFVNIMFESRPGSMFASQYSREMSNVHFYHVTSMQRFVWKDSLDAENVRVKNCIFPSMSATGSTAGLQISHNHFTSLTKFMGSEVTLGEAGFSDPANYDYSLLPTSPAFGTGDALQCVPADVNGRKYGVARNRGCYASVIPEPNTPPVVEAGKDQTITLSTAATLSGSATDDGLPNPPGALTFMWTKVSNFGSVTFSNPTAPVTKAVFSAAGKYVLQLTASDGELSASDTVTVTVIANRPIVVNFADEDTAVDGALAEVAEADRAADNNDAQDGADEPDDGSDVPVLIPGIGFIGATLEPEPVGTSGATGFDAKVIARWDVVPYQTFTGEFEIGVVAFHVNGIDRVEFSVEGGPWMSVYEMTMNPRTKVAEYCVRLDAALLPDGPIEIRAIAYPKQAGLPRLLAGPLDGTAAGSLDYRNGNHSMFLNANSGGSLIEEIVWADAVTGSDSTGDGTEGNPYASPTKALASITKKNGNSDGAICYLKPGDYAWAAPKFPDAVKTVNRWVTVMPAPGVDRSQVSFIDNPTGGLRTRLLCGRNITHRKGGPRTISSFDTYFWFDNSIVDGGDRMAGGSIAAGTWSGVYATDASVIESRNTFRSCTFVRNCTARGFTDTPLGQDVFAMNVRLDDFERHVSGTHADVIHGFWNDPGYRENRIIYGLHVTRFNCQGWQMNAIKGGGQQLDNVAFVNVHITKDAPGSVAGSWWSIDASHLLLWNVQLPDQPLRWKAHAQDEDGVLSLANVSIRNCVFGSFVYGPLPADSDVRHLHLRANGYGGFVPSGIDVTVGQGEELDALYVSPLKLDYRPRAGSIIDKRVPFVDIVVPYLLDGKRYTRFPAPLGALQTAYSNCALSIVR